MKNKHNFSLFTKCTGIVLALLMLFAFLPVSLSALPEAKAASVYSVGDVIEFGYYPQSRVSDEDVLAALSSDTAEWTSYGYYYGTNAYGTMVQGDYMKYKDVTLDGVKYRGVKVDKCRPSLIYSSLAASGMMTKNGYVKNNTYWFKYEPIKWKVLDVETGLVLCDSIIDSQAYSNTVYKTTESSVITYWKNSESTVYANNYADSTVREWLNDEFYNTAFAASQKEVIYKTSLNNDAYLEKYSIYNSVATEDNVFFLSYADVSKTEYGFTRVADRLAAGTDYAKCQGVSVASTGNSAWQLRSAGSNSNYVRSVGTNGDLTGVFNVASTSCGVRPAIRINLNAFEYTMFESGDTIEYGSYPQTDVTSDTSLCSELLTLAGDPTVDVSEWTAYGYYDAGNNDNDYMWYKDVESDGAKYRGVYFTSYRPTDNADEANEENSNQDNNGYEAGNVYWFKFEPVEFTVLSYDADENTAVLLASKAIDGKVFADFAEETTYESEGITGYANNYEISAIRQWLNGEFFASAFTSLEQSSVISVTNTNTALATEYDGNDTDDYIYLPAEADSAFATAEYSDYAAVQGIAVNSAEKTAAAWMLRTAGTAANMFAVVTGTGAAEAKVNTVNALRPAFTLDVKTAFCEHKFTTQSFDSKCAEKGYTLYTCSECGVTYKDNFVDELGHIWDEGIVTTPASCTTDGVKTFTCQRSGCTGTKTEKIDAIGHSITKVDAKAPSCTENGNNEYYFCSNCKCAFKDAEGNTSTSIADETIAAEGHQWGEWKNGERTCTVENCGAVEECEHDGYNAGETCGICGKTVPSKSSSSGTSLTGMATLILTFITYIITFFLILYGVLK